MKETKTEDRIYFAGLLDGEGCVLVVKNKGKSQNGYISYGLRVAFGLTYKPILLEMKNLFGGHICKRDMKKAVSCNSAQRIITVDGFSPEKWKQLYQYELNGRDALYFLKVVEPFCREKKEQVALAIRYEQGRRPFAGSYGRSKSETERCEFFYKELQRLKHEQSDETDNEIDFEDEQQTLFSFEEEDIIVRS